MYEVTAGRDAPTGSFTFTHLNSTYTCTDPGHDLNYDECAVS